jgi:hypothetical protein
MTPDILMAVAATITALGILVGASLAIYRVAKRIGDALGVDHEGRTIADRLDRVEHQLWENGGSSLADRVNNIDRHIVKVSTEIEFIKDLTLGLHNQANPVLPPVVEPLIKPTRTTRTKKAS